MLSRDGWGGLAVLTASLFLFVLTLGLKESPLVPIGPGFYPRIVLGITAVLALALVVADFAARARRKPAERSGANYRLVTAMFAVFGVYVLAMPYLGFRIATLLYLASANAMLDRPRGLRGWARVALIALVTTIVVYYVFERYLTVLLPRGRWTDF